MSRRIQLERLTWHVEKNCHAEPALEGADAWVAWPEQLAEARRYGSSRDEAERAARGAAKERLGTLTDQEREAILIPMAQINLKIPVTVKEQLCELAEKAGMSLTWFLVRQALHAPNPAAVTAEVSGVGEEMLRHIVKEVVEQELAEAMPILQAIGSGPAPRPERACEDAPAVCAAEPVEAAASADD